MDILGNKNVAAIVMRTLNHVDSRLVDHGVRVAYLVLKMLQTDGMKDGAELRDCCFVSLLHDIGAYKTEEIDQMVQFETNNVWEHSVYGHLFLRYLSPLKKFCPALLFHHTDYEILQGIDTPLKSFSQILNLADRADVYMKVKNDQGLMDHLHMYSGNKFSPYVLELFEKTEEKYQVLEKLNTAVCLNEVLDELNTVNFTDEEIDTYLNMVIFAIDFRSQHTVTHTITTTSISMELSLRMNLPAERLHKVKYGALLHDLGKISIPVEILEFPGKLSPQAMAIMKTHVDITEEILKDEIDEEVMRIALRHHEKLDGSGYPRGLNGAMLTLEERIVAVADIVSALCGTRSYKGAYPKEKTLGIIKQMSDDGLICSKVAQMMTKDFDSIMKSVDQNCAPILEAYHSIYSEYESLIAKARQL